MTTHKQMHWLNSNKDCVKWYGQNNFIVSHTQLSSHILICTRLIRYAVYARNIPICCFFFDDSSYGVASAMVVFSKFVG